MQQATSSVSAWDLYVAVFEQWKAVKFPEGEGDPRGKWTVEIPPGTSREHALPKLPLEILQTFANIA